MLKVDLVIILLPNKCLEKLIKPTTKPKIRPIISPNGEESKLLSKLYPIKIKINKEATKV